MGSKHRECFLLWIAAQTALGLDLLRHQAVPWKYSAECAVDPRPTINWGAPWLLGPAAAWYEARSAQC